jgi:hypothetical protein
VLGAGAAGLFMLALLASGFSSSVVGVMAGQVIMQGFVSFRIPLWLRRLVVMMPSFAVIIAGMDINHALVLSQVVLSLILPIPMVALVRLTANRDVMGEFANSRLTNAVAVTATVFVSALNAVLLLGIVGLGARPSNSQQAEVLAFYCRMAHQAGAIQQFCPVECIILSSSELLGRAPRDPTQRRLNTHRTTRADPPGGSLTLTEAGQVCRR